MTNQSKTAAIIQFFIFAFVVGAVFWLSSPNQDGQNFSFRQVASVSSQSQFKKLQRQKTVKRISPFELQKVNLNFRQMKKDSPAFAQMNQGKSKAQDLWILPAGTELLAVIDRECATKPAMIAQMNQQSFSNVLVDRNVNRTGLKTQAFGFQLDREMTIDELTNLATADPCLKGISENGRVHAGSLYGDPSVTQQNQLTNLEATSAEEFFFDSSLMPAKPVVLAVVDTGVDYKHVDLVNNIWSDSQGRHGFDFVNQDNDPLDDNFHGTHVAGLAAAVGGNDLGGAGVMPTNIQLMAVKILDKDGDGSYENVTNGILWAVEKGADLINLSLSGPGENAGVADALIQAANNGIPVFISAGNNGVELNDSTNFRTPTSYGQQIKGVITVGSIDALTSEKSSFSNFGSDYVEIGSPGSNGIFSTLPDNKFGELEGTSMATPIAAGVGAIIIATLKAKNYVFTAAEVEEILMDSAKINSNLSAFFAGGRQINLDSLKKYLFANFLVQSDGGILESE